MLSSTVGADQLPLSSDVQTAFSKLRLNKSKASALILKVNKASLMVEVDTYLESLDSVEDLADNLPETEPRFVIFSYEWKRDDGRVQMPIIDVFYSPECANPNSQMLYTRGKVAVSRDLSLSKHMELQDLDDWTEEWLLERLMKSYK